MNNRGSSKDLMEETVPDDKIPLLNAESGESTAKTASVPVNPLPYILFWITSSCSLILFNKAILSQFDFPYPMFLTFWHMLFATICTQILSRTTNMLPGVDAQKVDTQILISKFLPISFLFSISLICANRAYLFLSVSFIQMLKAFTPVCVLIASAATGLEKPSITEFMILFVVTIGVAIASYGELRFDYQGFVFQVVSVCCESTRLVLTNVTVKKLDLDSLSTLYYIAPMACVCIFIPFCVFESETFPFEKLESPNFLMMMVVNGCIAFSLNIASVLVMTKASALILALSGIVKDVLLVVLSMVVFLSPVTVVQFFGYGLALAGLHGHKEYKKNPQIFFKSMNCETGKPALISDSEPKPKPAQIASDGPRAASPNSRSQMGSTLV